MITKKMIVSAVGSKDFLVPNYETGKGYISIKNGKEVDVGIVVYTGVELDGNAIVKKIEKYNQLLFKWAKDSDLFNEYLSCISKLKISKKYYLSLDVKELKFDIQN
jgi:hypothetical protein